MFIYNFALVRHWSAIRRQYIATKVKLLIELLRETVVGKVRLDGRKRDVGQTCLVFSTGEFLITPKRNYTHGKTAKLEILMITYLYTVCFRSRKNKEIYEFLNNQHKYTKRSRKGLYFVNERIK